MCGKYVRRVDLDSSRRETRGYRAVLLASLALLAMLVTPTLSSILNIASIAAAHIDPELYTVLQSGGRATAYVVAYKPVIGSIKQWVFGDIVVSKVVIDFNTLVQLANDPAVISVYGEKTLKHAPLHFLNTTEYPFRDVDIDNKFHMATGPWTGRGVVVAVIDTGIDYTHPDFYDDKNRTIIEVLVSTIYSENGHPLVWIPYVNGTMEDLLKFDKYLWRERGEPAFLDINGHGTHVAGIIAGQGRASNGKYVGIAPGARLVIVKALNANGTATFEQCLDALEWVYDNAEKYNIKILSLSWGAPFASDGTDPLSIAVDAIAKDKGVWVFAAAGNEGNIPTTITVPAVAHYAWAVGAWDPYYDRLAPFSSLGPTIDLRMKPDFMGAGVMIVSCKSQYADFPDDYEVDNYYVALSGTSMATPAVAGVAATFIEYYRYWHGKDPTREDFIEWVRENGRRINPIAKDFITGWGIPIAPHS